MITFTYIPGSGVVVDGRNLSGFSNTSLSNGYLYHVHLHPVANFDGNMTVEASMMRCEAALSHLDP